MANVYPGINNYNEYYTNHYFSSIFEENASATISVWRDAAKASENLRTPWSLLREIAKQYYVSHDKALRARSRDQIKPLIKELAESYLSALGYPAPAPFNHDLQNGTHLPVFLEIKKSNGNPLLWVMLSVNAEDDDDILQGHLFSGDFSSGYDFVPAYTCEDFNAEEAVTKALFSNDVPPRWIVVIGLNGIALIDRNKWSEKRYLAFDLATIYSYRDEKTFQAMAVLLHKDSLCPEEGEALLDELDENSHRHAAGVSKDLKYALRESIELLGNEILYDLKTNKHRDLDKDPVDPGDLTMQCLRYMYRMLFVLFIEAREELGYAPMKEMAYAKGYSLEQLRDVADNINENVTEVGEGYYFNETINKLFHLIYHGYPEKQEDYDAAVKMESKHDTFVVPPLKAHIFDPDLTPLITQAKIRNKVLLRIIRLMSITRGDNKSGGNRISYANLGINQLGSVYESLLSYRGFIAEKDLYEVKRAGDVFDELDVGYFVSETDLVNYNDDERVRYESGPHKGKPRMYQKGMFIYRLAGREREKSASYYTPEVLTKCLVKYALKELLVDKTADDILNLTICEPAMGSAAFLNEAINQLADAYVNKKQEELGELIKYEDRKNEVQKVKMFIADRNVYGVDLNSTAVELAEVSLWLNTICEGGHIPWFGTQIVNGNSLIGARKQVYRIEQLQTSNPALKWYTKAPDRIAPHETRRGSKEVYHFLLGDPGMCNYTDKVIKDLAPKQIAMMKEWNKRFTESYNPDDIESLIRLSGIVDTLWHKQIELRKEVKKRTADKLSIFGHDDNIEESHTTIRQKDYIFRNLYKTEKAENAGPYARLKFAMDYWCALWFWPIEKADLLPSRETFIFDMNLILEGGIYAVKGAGYSGTYKKTKSGDYIYEMNLLDYNPETEEYVNQAAQEIRKTFEDLGNVNLDQLCEQYERLALVRDIARENHFMHWELEFAELFEERGGFDLMIGNPPWVKITWQEEGVLSDCNPRFAIKKMSAAETMEERLKELSNPVNRKMYFNEYISISGLQSFLSNQQNYSELEGLQTNLYLAFFPTSLRMTNSGGVFAFVHPNGVFNDREGKPLRELLIPRLRKSYQFMNMLKLFHDVHPNVVFYLNVFCQKVTDTFELVCNLYDPGAIDDTYDSNCSYPLEGLRNEKGEWSRHGNPERLIIVDKEGIRSFSLLLDDVDCSTSCRIGAFHTQKLFDIAKIFALSSKKVSNFNNKIQSSMLLDETNAQKAKIITKKTNFPSSFGEVVYSGPHINIANPFSKCSNAVFNSNTDYETIDLIETKGIDYIQRVTYILSNKNGARDSSPETSWGNSHVDNYRFATRKMINLTQERTLIGSLIPPNAFHTNGIMSISFKNLKDLVSYGAACCSLPFDCIVKLFGKVNFTIDSANKLPVLNDDIYSKLAINRFLRLNCLSSSMTNLWNKCLIELEDNWSKNDTRLSKSISMFGKWNENLVLYDDLSRRQALLEIDVLVALNIGMTLEQLIYMYNVQFPVFQKFENETYYDQNGRVVFSAKNYGELALKRPEWELIKNMKTGTYKKTISDDTMPGGPIERTIEYVAPFTKCDRVEDYKTAWEFFTKKYGEVSK